MRHSRKPKASSIFELKLDYDQQGSVENPRAGVNSLLSEQIPQIAAKLSVHEHLLNLLTRDLTFDEFVRETLLCVMGAIRCEAGSILEVDQNEGTLFFRAAVGHSSDQIANFVIPLGSGIAGHVAESKEPFLSANLEVDQRHLRTIAKSVGFSPKNLIAVPLFVRARVYGVLELINRVGESEFSAVDLELANQICEAVGRALEIRLMLGWTYQRARTPKRRKGDAA